MTFLGGSGAISDANIFKTGAASAAGDTAIWTPTAGKRFVLLGYILIITANATATVAGTLELLFRDGTTPLGIGGAGFIPSTGPTQFQVDDIITIPNLGAGIPSAVINNPLNLNLSFALTAGEVRAQVMGIEI